MADAKSYAVVTGNVKAKPYEPGITEALSLTEDYNTCVRLQTPSNVIREDEAPREPLEIR